MELCPEVFVLEFEEHTCSCFMSASMSARSSGVGKSREEMPKAGAFLPRKIVVHFLV